MTDVSKAHFSATVVVEHLRRTCQLQEIYTQLLKQYIVRQGARVRQLTVTPDEIQAEAERIRRQHQLEKATDTFAWLSHQLMEPEDWEAGIYGALLERKLIETLFSTEVEKIFAQNKLNFERVVLYQMQVHDLTLAQELRFQVLEKERTFCDAAHHYDADPERRLRCGYEGTLSRWQLMPAIAAAIFGSPPGRIIGPLTLDDQHYLFMAEAFMPAELTDDVREEILTDLFEEWLEPEINHLLYNDAIASDSMENSIEPVPA